MISRRWNSLLLSRSSGAVLLLHLGLMDIKEIQRCLNRAIFIVVTGMAGNV